MSESTMQSATELASQYSTQVNDDLERNIKEQERVSTEITALQQQLAALQHDHALLVNMQQALGITSPPPSPTAPEPAAETATVPAPRGGTAAQSAKGVRTRSKRATTAPKRAAAPKPGAKKASKPAAKKATRSTATTAAKSAAEAPAKTTTKPVAKSTAKQAPKAAGKSAAQKAPSRPTLVELVREHLAGQREPRSAAEVTAALGEAHSGRAVKTTVVRTTLEGLVAKNQAQRTKQGTSVYYSATEAPAPARQQDSAAESASAQSGS
ncbi:hypothetical protein RVN83_34755 [Streptomyces sp. PU10]|uniref:hypothetical protein n=1 Tax=Streptomyces TaxID=1883 RepID=UPI00159257C0|nr:MULTISPECIES: hypothetical protein [unclassified Streptomyces]MDU0258111.1 hypothetical protein [Streptomyces sp. PU10]QKW59267.1 hypothetical protein HUT15_01370 [Streptomyces sp. NA03103]WST99440.1 hypothetical protein OG368_02145 [Streptomyces sp. NBC_01124]